MGQVTCKDESATPPTIIQDLAKKHMNGYVPDYHGIVYDGRQIIGKNKAKIKPSQAKKFMQEVEKHYAFDFKHHTVTELFLHDEDLFVYFTRHASGDGFDFRTD